MNQCSDCGSDIHSPGLCLPCEESRARESEPASGDVLLQWAEKWIDRGVNRSDGELVQRRHWDAICLIHGLVARIRRLGR